MEVDEISSPSAENVVGENQNSNSTESNELVVSESGTPIEDGYSDLWLEFKCVFCNHDLKNISQPKLLQCLHTACESCLTSVSNGDSAGATSTASGWSVRNKKKQKTGRKTSVTRLSGGSKQLQCPICFQEINTADVVDHLFLTEYAENSENLPEECSFPCTSCDEGAEGSAFCQECQEWLCDNCVSAHHRVRVTKDHTVRPKDEIQDDIIAGRNQKYLFCPTHSHEQLKLYCESCDKLTCRDCQLSDHKDHKYQFLTNACEEEKGNIADLLTKIKEKQTLIDDATSRLNKRNEEIIEREKILIQEIKHFAIKFITDVNKRSKKLLDDLNKVCKEKRNQVLLKNDEFKSVSERLKHSQKFAEAAITLGSETALVYSKKPIMNQLRRILRHRCEVPNPSQTVDIQFNYETDFLCRYISTLGTLLVDGQQLPGSNNQNAMLPMPRSMSQSPTVPNPPPPRASFISQPQQQFVRMAQPQNQMVPYNQPLVTSTTDLARNQVRQVLQPTRQMANFNPQNMNVLQRQRVAVPQQNNFNIQQQRHAVPQQQVQMRQIPQQQQQPPPQQQQQQQQMHTSTPSVPAPLRKNSSISVTPVANSSGPSPSKQRAIAIAPQIRGLSMTPVNNNNNSGSPQRSSNNNNNSQSTPSRGPQLIVLDDQNKPNMSNTNRLSHFPANLPPGLQIQPATNYNSSRKK